MSAGDAMVTVTPGSTAPLSSTVVPINRPVVVCAATLPATTTITNITAAACFIVPSPQTVPGRPTRQASTTEKTRPRCPDREPNAL